MTVLVDVEGAIGPPHLWDMALENREKCIDRINNLVVRVIACPTHTLKPCRLCSVESLVDVLLLAHVISEHSKASITRKQLLAHLLAISDSDSAFYGYIKSLYRLL